MSSVERLAVSQTTGEAQVRAVKPSGGRRLALVVGINYKGSGAQLGGCEVDAGKMSGFFRQRGYEVVLMTETERQARSNDKLAPTKTNIAACLSELMSVQDLDKFAFAFAGHGSQLSDQNSDELDGRDECLVCQSPRGASFMPTASDFYRDDDILSLVRSKLAKKPVDCFFMFDACHSGTVLDLGMELSRQSSWKKVRGYMKDASGASGSGDLCNIVAISGCQDSECSLEAGDGGGMMTSKFMAAINKGAVTLGGINREFATMGFQCPQISSSTTVSLDTVFGEKIIVGLGRSLQVIVARRSVQPTQQLYHKIKMAYAAAIVSAVTM